ncbi:MAG: hypothetical protein A2V70_10315 [Planctomycetes bacterium RBG_13_63_9]|nr:MAG: hypothetical protein A2V70_10315 [Planctomycetes bacterium RBG_13_63_9]
MHSWSMVLPLLAVVVVGGGCHALPNVRATLPQKYTVAREQLVVHSDFPLATQHRLLEELTARRFDISRCLGLPVSNEPIHVYLFDSADAFREFIRLHYPDFPDRRAFFVETDTRLVVYAHWGDRVAVDLRHEVTHGYLHSAVPNLPLWLDEGLAEYFEVPRGHNGMNREHLDRLLIRLEQDRWQPDLRRVAQFDSTFDMSQDDYAEAWAWTHFLLHSGVPHRELLHQYLEELRRDGTGEPFRPRLGRMLPQPEGAVVEHVRRLAASSQ